MTYGVLNGLDSTFEAAKQRGIKVIANVWLDDTPSTNDDSITLGIQMAKQYPETIVRLSCGVEVRTRHGAAVAEPIINNCINKLKAASVTQPVTSIDTWYAWCNEHPTRDDPSCEQWTNLVNKVDWIGINIYPWWENKYSGIYTCIPAEEASDFHIARMNQVINAYSGKEVILTEFGWPAGPDGYRVKNLFDGQQCGIAGEANQKQVIWETVVKLMKSGYSYVVFETFREPWKVNSPDEDEKKVGPYWGICTGTQPYTCEFRPNLAAQVSSTYYEPRNPAKWQPEHVVDNDQVTEWSSQAHSEHLSGAEFIFVKLPAATTIDRIRLWPRPNQSDPDLTLGFPEDFNFLYDFTGESSCELDGFSWKPLQSYFSQQQPPNKELDFTFAPTIVNCIMWLATELSPDDYGNRYLQLSEFEIYSDTKQIALSNVVASSTYQEPKDPEKWSSANLIDGKKETEWSSQAHWEHLSNAEYVFVKLTVATTIDRIRLWPRPNQSDANLTLGFPEDFNFLYDFTGDSSCELNTFRWKPLRSYFSQQQPSNKELDFTFAEPIKVNCIMWRASELSPDDYGNRYLQLSEFEVYSGTNQVALSDVIVSSTYHEPKDPEKWSSAHLIDGKRETEWSSQAHSEHLNGAEYVFVKLPLATTIDRIRLRPRPNQRDPHLTLGFPEDFNFLYDFTGDSPCDLAKFGWKPLQSYFSQRQPSNQNLEFTFTPIVINCIMWRATELSPDDYGNRYLQLSGLEFFYPTSTGKKE